MINQPRNFGRGKKTERKLKGNRKAGSHIAYRPHPPSKNTNSSPTKTKTETTKPPPQWHQDQIRGNGKKRKGKEKREGNRESPFVRKETPVFCVRQASAGNCQISQVTQGANCPIRISPLLPGSYLIGLSHIPVQVDWGRSALTSFAFIPVLLSPPPSRHSHRRGIAPV